MNPPSKKKKSQENNKNSLGKQGEDRAVYHIEEAGLKVITRNFRSKAGEVDIVAIDGSTIVFIEVKAWSAFSIENLEYSISKKKQQRIIETAKFFLLKHREYSEASVRFDVLFIGIDTIKHITAAFTESV
ncbi:UPF0102 protein [Spirochaetia bacterium]|nr:UPF0102 protein [Spirochaetia bacterium]